jgi:hypothetical protein
MVCKVIAGHQLFNTLWVHPEYKKVNFLTINFLSAMRRKLTILTEAEMEVKSKAKHKNLRFFARSFFNIYKKYINKL